MRRASFVVSALVAGPLIALAPTMPASAGGVAVSIGITHSPAVFTVGQDGTFTVTLSDPQEVQNSDFDYDVIDTVPASFSISSVDAGDFACETDNSTHTVECTIEAVIDASSTEAFTIHTTPSTTVGSPFTDTASYTFQEPPTSSPTPIPTPTVTVTETEKSERVAHPELAFQGQTATDQVAVRAPASPSPTPTPTATPTHTHTAQPSTPTASPSVSATHAAVPPATLPNTGGNDDPQLVALAALLISGGAFLAAVTRRRRT
jgi:LPXTG-motif cell wall-anchored protein